ncbi:Tox-REase-5 domain-containing protein [Caballeronia sp. LZ016]|uniref:Tox-REase-5 domain-containing protein n=1 Tax=Caballeronia sp. LZ016 TaxID=3038554 RepID=UPI002865D9F3|nr:Tox-REase-5 domain-containing protein [Caballeronia sp. LZ016]MDR5738075.1 Tox-REase-5 domain-containing protein [Caballeronia sp. LZ016]
MAALAVPLLEGVGELIATAWAAFASSGAATAVVGGVATGAVLSLPGDTAKDEDKAKTETGAATRTQSRNCKCPPDKGMMGPPPHKIAGLSAAYQQYVTGFPMGQEWYFAPIWFDGFRSQLCQLEEAKARYDQFFLDDGQPKYWWVDTGGADMIDEAQRQNVVVMANPGTKLRWFFMQPRSCAWATRQFASRAFLITTEVKPMA